MIPKILKSNDEFPDVSLALKSPNGLLAIGGQLTVSQLINAYKHGIFPWYTTDQPLLWWSPDPRAVLYFDNLRISRSLKKILRHKPFQVTIDHAFQEVVEACAAPRIKQPETWITDEMQQAYYSLHKKGYAHSIEVWQNEKLIGGLYGVDCGRIFSGESMFNKEPNAAKIALVYLVEYLKIYNYFCIDCQINNPYLMQLGATDISRKKFISLLEQGLSMPKTNAWQTKQVLPFILF